MPTVEKPHEAAEPEPPHDDEDVQDDLKATPEQRKQIRALTGKLWQQWGQAWAKLSKLSPDKRQTQLADLARDQVKAVLAALTPEQGKRLQQIGLQVQQRGPEGFRDPELIAALQLTPKQQQEIRKLQQEAYQPLFSQPLDSPKAMRERMEKLQLKLQQRIMEVLTAEQRGRWQTLTGEPYTDGFPFPGPGGFAVLFAPPPPGGKGGPGGASQNKN